MIIDFDKIDVSHLKNFMGGEKELEANLFIDEKHKVLRGKLVPHSSIGLHTHNNSDEVIYIVKGCAKFICNGKEEIVNEGCAQYCKCEESHTLINDTDDDIIFIGVVTKYE